MSAKKEANSAPRKKKVKAPKKMAEKNARKHLASIFPGLHTNPPEAADSDIFDEDVESATEFLKKDETVFGVDLDTIPLRQASSHASYELYWALPSKGIRSILRSHFVLENVSGNTLWVRAQRPMGYHADPAGVAAWEPVSGSVVQEIRPFSRWRFTIKHTVTNVATPRMVMMGGAPHLHVMSWMVFREPESDIGVKTDTPSTQTGYTLTGNVEFTSSESSSGSQKSMRVLTFSGSNHMDHLDPPPSPPVHASSVVTPAGPPDALLFFDATKDKPAGPKCVYMGMTTGLFNRPGPVYSYQPDKAKTVFSSPSLDEGTVYAIGVDVPTSAIFKNGYSTSASTVEVHVGRLLMVYVDRETAGFVKDRWNLVSPSGNGIGMVLSPVRARTGQNAFTCAYSMSGSGSPDAGIYIHAGDATLTPVMRKADAIIASPTGVQMDLTCYHNKRSFLQRSPPETDLSIFRKGQGRPLRLKVDRVEGLSDFFETVLEAVRVIVKIVKVATVVAGALGLMSAAQMVRAPVPTRRNSVNEEGFVDCERIVG